MSEVVAFRAQHQTAAVTVTIQVEWTEPVTDDDIIETLALIYAEAAHRATQKRKSVYAAESPGQENGRGS